MESPRTGKDSKKKKGHKEAQPRWGSPAPGVDEAEAKTQEPASFSKHFKRFRVISGSPRRRHALAVLAATVGVLAVVFMVRKCFLPVKQQAAGGWFSRRLAVGGAECQDSVSLTAPWLPDECSRRNNSCRPC